MTTETGQATDEALREFKEFLAIPSISALSEHQEDVQRAAEWVADRLRRAGMEHVEIMPTAGHPLVYADWLHAPGKPTVLIYGHFDVQPVDPVELWTTGPFEPTVRDGRIYARGASDMKGNLLLSILGVEDVLRQDGTLPVNVKFLYEGQEEILSPQLPEFIGGHQELLAADLVLNADSGQYSEDQPALIMATKGVCGIQVDVYGANSDLHSGLFGGAAPNAALGLVQILSTMKASNGRILVEGFYDQVIPLSEEERATIAEVPFDESRLREQFGVNALPGEEGYTAVECMWGRPTLEINGLWGGFQGQGIKTVIPKEAHAKITCRLVADQDPERIIEMLKQHVERHTPPGYRAEVHSLESTARPYLMPRDHWANQAATEVLTEIYGRKPYYLRTGGSVPVTELFQRFLGADSLGVGFGLNDEQYHAPDEFWRLSSFQRGREVWPKLLRRLGTGA